MYVILDGIDGGGKTLQVSKLYNYFTDKLGASVPVSIFIEPNAEIIKALPYITPQSYTMAAYAQRVAMKHIIETISRDGFAIGDRSYESTFAYQGQYEYEFVTKLHQCLVDEIAEPDLKILIKVPPKLAISRIVLRENRVVSQSEFEMLTRAAQIYECRFVGSNCRVVDGSLPPDIVHRHILNHIEARLTEMIHERE